MEGKKELHPLDYFSYCPHCGSKEFRIDGTRSKHCEACGFTFYFNPAASVAALISNSQGQLLLTRRSFEPQKGTLDLPGGFAELDESLEDALRREVGEELGIEIENITYLTSYPNRYPFSGLTVHTLDSFFTATIKPGSQTIRPNDDVDHYVWMSKEDIDPQTIGLTSIRKVVEQWKNAK